MSSPGFSDPDGMDDPSAEAEEAEEAEEDVSLEATLPGAIPQAKSHGPPPRLARDPGAPAGLTYPPVSP